MLAEADHDSTPPESPDNSHRSVLRTWLPFLWLRVLFPGAAPALEAIRLSSLLWLFVVPGLLLYGCLTFHLFEPDEGRYAEIPREMLVRGEWTVPYLQGEPYLDKPPLFYWLVMLSYQTFGIHTWSARLVPAVAVHISILVTYLLGRRLLGERAAFWGAMLLSLAPGYGGIGRLLVLDGLLTLWVVLALLAGFEATRTAKLRWGWWLISAVGCGLGILTKGPIALILMAPPLWAHRRLTGLGCPLTWPSLAAFAATMLAVSLPWYVAICLKLPSFGAYFLWQHNVLRFVAPFDHLEPIWFFVPIVLAGLLPGTLLLFSFGKFLLSGATAIAERRPAELGFSLLSGGWCVLFFSLSGSKLPTYVLPAFPLLALAMGYYLVAGRRLQSHWPRTIAAGWFGLMFLGHNVALPRFADYRAPLGRLAEMESYIRDKNTPIVCYPRSCDSIAFYLGRDDMQNYRSKETNLLVAAMQQRDRTVVLLTHRHSLQGLKYALTPDLRVTSEHHFGLAEISGLPESLAKRISKLMGETALGLCDLAVVERVPTQKE